MKHVYLAYVFFMLIIAFMFYSMIQEVKTKLEIKQNKQQILLDNIR